MLFSLSSITFVFPFYFNIISSPPNSATTTKPPPFAAEIDFMLIKIILIHPLLIKIKFFITLLN